MDTKIELLLTKFCRVQGPCAEATLCAPNPPPGGWPCAAFVCWAVFEWAPAPSNLPGSFTIGSPHSASLPRFLRKLKLWFLSCHVTLRVRSFWARAIPLWGNVLERSQATWILLRWRIHRLGLGYIWLDFTCQAFVLFLPVFPCKSYKPHRILS